MYSELRAEVSKDPLPNGKILDNLAAVLDCVDKNYLAKNYSEIDFEGATPLKNYHQMIQALKSEIRIPLAKETIPEDLDLFAIFKIPSNLHLKKITTNGCDKDLQERKKIAQRCFVAGISRNYNNLLMGIQGYLSLISLSLESTHPYRSIIRSAEELVQSGSFAISLLLGYLAERRGQTRKIRFRHLINEVATFQTNVPQEEDRQQFEQWIRDVPTLDGLAHISEKCARSFDRLVRSIVTWIEWIRLSEVIDTATFERLSKIKYLAEQGFWISGKLLAFASKGNFNFQKISLNEVIDSCLEKFSKHHGSVQLRKHFRSDDIFVVTDPGHLSQAFSELLQNAAESMSWNGKLTLSVKKLTLARRRSKWPTVDPGTYVQVSIKDTGCGIDGNTINKVFDPFYTTKAGGKGAGLGLSMVYGVAKQMGGVVRIDSKHGSLAKKGSYVKLLLPRV
jgi:signal transduction histidine kinase